MAYTQAQVDALRAAIATGVIQSRVDGINTTFRSLDDMMKLLGIMEASVAGTSEPPRRTVGAYNSGA